MRAGAGPSHNNYVGRQTTNLDMLMRHLGADNDKLKVDGLELLPNLIAKRWGNLAAPESKRMDPE